MNEENEPAALSLLVAAAEKGDVGAMVLVARYYDAATKDETKDPADLQTARMWYERAATADDAVAQFALANMLDYGEGGQQSDQDARRWYEKAAQQGFAEAQMHIARMLELGRGGYKSSIEAAYWYQKAIEQGHELAAVNLGAMHYKKELPESSDQTAFILFRIAEDKLDGVGALMLGEMCLEGRGTEKHDGQALLHYQIASLLLSDGSNCQRALAMHEAILAAHPEHREYIKNLALSFIRERAKAAQREISFASRP